MGKLTLKNNINSEFTIEHRDGVGSKNISVDDMKYIRNTMKELIEDVLLVPNEGDVLFLKGYHEIGDQGDGTFIWDPNEPKANHNGGTVIDPSKQFPSDWNNEDLKDSWFNTTNEGTGCWKRVFDSAVNISWFGAKGDGVIDDTKSIQKAIDNSHILILNSKDEYLTKELFLPETSFYLKGNNSTIKTIDNEFSSIRLIKADKSNDYFEGKNIIIDGLHIVCNNQTNGIDFRYAMYNCEIKNCIIEGSVSSAIKLDNCWAMKVKRNTIKSGKYNLWLGGANGVIVSENRFMNANFYGIKCTASELTGENNRMLTIQKNVIEYSQKSAIYIDASKIINIKDNYIEDCAKEYNNTNAYIDIIDNSYDIKTVNILSNVLKDPETNSYTWAIKSTKCVLLNIRNNVFDHFNNNLLKLYNVWECHIKENDFFGLTNSVIDVNEVTKIFTDSKENLFLNSGLSSWQKSTNTDVGGYCCVDNIYINKSGATVQSSKLDLDINEFAGSGSCALKLNCTVADDNWGAFIRMPLDTKIFNNWLVMSVWLKANAEMPNVELSGYIKINNNKSQPYLSDNRITITTEWKLYYISFRVYDFNENIDINNSFITMNVIHKDNSTGVLYIGNPQVQIGRIPSTTLQNIHSSKVYNFIEVMEVGTVNGDVRYSFSKKDRLIESLSTSLGTITQLGENSFKLNHNADDDVAIVVIDAQWL